MKLHELQDQLRVHIRSRIGRKELTGIRLARAAGFPQGHLSNFLNARRGLSLESMDRLLQTLGIGVLDLVDDREIQSAPLYPLPARVSKPLSWSRRKTPPSPASPHTTSCRQAVS